MANRKKNTTSAKETVLLVTATRSEALYFNQMRKDCRYMNVTVEWAGRDDLDLTKLINETSRLKRAGKYDHVWAVFGFDEVDTDVLEVSSMLEVAARKRISLCWFNPCFELWIALHAGPLATVVQDPTPIKARVGQALPGFEMSPEYLLTKGINLHLQLFPRHATADINARNYNERAKNMLGLEATNMPALNSMLLDVCGQADMSHNQKAFK